MGFNLLTGEAASQSLKETIDKDYCECGMPLETIRVSYGMEPEQEALSIVSFKD